MRVIQLKAENVKRLQAVDITPQGDMITITGKNGQGKTSVLDAIWFAIGGGEAMKNTRKPIREGEEAARAVVDLGDIKVTRTWTQKGTYLKVENADGAEYKAPQVLLDKLVGRLSFDPLAFSLMDEKKRREVLLGLVRIDLDLEAWSKERQELFEERTGVNRQLKETAAVVKAFGEFPEDLPAEEVPAFTILQEQTGAMEHKRANDMARQDLQDNQGLIAQFSHETEELAERIKELEAKLKDLRETYSRNVKTIEARNQEIAEEMVRVKALVDPDLSVFETKLAELEQLNSDIRAKQNRDRQAHRVKVLQAQADTLTELLAGKDKERAEALAAANFPVPGLGFDDEGVTFEGIPFSQCSDAERLKVSLAMAMALNPKIRILRITNGSLLDDDNLAIIKEMIAEHDFQLWIERVGEDGKVGVLIEDGMIVPAEG